ncbi:RidA family protein [Herbaspirillum rubrisubalbicans Os34]|uniref:RidA family protein n=1 Tax=Herbaspirillum rubrisubalbicans Os34 TaxID=1235827 RepID=A0A6M3ZVS8_9BURK|nr:RidA family protein [Herbaspirillum rubrisubalbicans]QJQ02471.1 RidA family protein [Herbaspirillum rubrisubalbicans Os34]
MNLKERLQELSIDLPVSSAPGAKYATGVLHQGLAWISGQLPREGDRVLVSGKLGREVSVEAGQEGARVAFIRALAALRDTVGGLDGVDRILRLNVYVNCTEDFSQHSAVADGASALIYQIFGAEKGAHARTSVGVAQLPRNACVELDIVVALNV